MLNHTPCIIIMCIMCVLCTIFHLSKCASRLCTNQAPCFLYIGVGRSTIMHNAYYCNTSPLLTQHHVQPFLHTVCNNCKGNRDTKLRCVSQFTSLLTKIRPTELAKLGGQVLQRYNGLYSCQTVGA